MRRRVGGGALALGWVGRMSIPAPRFSLCVYCGANPGAKPIYADVATQVGQWIAQKGGQLVYGGGRNGLMGIVADACLNAGGRVVGVIPKALQAREWAHLGCTELHVVETMAQRKNMMIERADAFLALPGGIGTFEEFFEVWTLATLGYISKPVGLLNTEAYFDDLLAMLEKAQSEGFLSLERMAYFQSGSQPLALCEQLVRLAGVENTKQIA